MFYDADQKCTSVYIVGFQNWKGEVVIRIKPNSCHGAGPHMSHHCYRSKCRSGCVLHFIEHWFCPYRCSPLLCMDGGANCKLQLLWVKPHKDNHDNTVASPNCWICSIAPSMRTPCGLVSLSKISHTLPLSIFVFRVELKVMLASIPLPVYGVCG